MGRLVLTSHRTNTQLTDALSPLKPSDLDHQPLAQASRCTASSTPVTAAPSWVRDWEREGSPLAVLDARRLIRIPPPPLPLTSCPQTCATPRSTIPTVAALGGAATPCPTRAPMAALQSSLGPAGITRYGRFCCAGECMDALILNCPPPRHAHSSIDCTLCNCACRLHKIQTHWAGGHTLALLLIHSFR